MKPSEIKVGVTYAGVLPDFLRTVIRIERGMVVYHVDGRRRDGWCEISTFSRWSKKEVPDG